MPGVAKIYKTTDFGVSWQLSTPHFGNNIFANKTCAWVSDSDHAWIALWCLSANCAAAQVAFTTNGGINWNISNVETGRQGVQSVAFSNDNQLGFASTYKNWQSNHLLTTTNGGINWFFVDTIPTGNVISHLTISGTSDWFINGVQLFPDSTWKPYVYKSTNNGDDWIRMQLLNPDEYFMDMEGIYLNNRLYVYGAGEGRILKHIDTASVISIQNEGNILPKSIELEQNYPNPFNPSTLINFCMSQRSFIVLKVYDVYGKELKTLIRGFKDAGRYSVEFNGTEVASGIYFYRLDSPNYSVSRKMVIVK